MLNILVLLALNLGFYEADSPEHFLFACLAYLEIAKAMTSAEFRYICCWRGSGADGQTQWMNLQSMLDEKFWSADFEEESSLR
jgi:hypothetical protein